MMGGTLSWMPSRATSSLMSPASTSVNVRKMRSSSRPLSSVSLVEEDGSWFVCQHRASTEGPRPAKGLTLLMAHTRRSSGSRSMKGSASHLKMRRSASCGSSVPSEVISCRHSASASARHDSSYSEGVAPAWGALAPARGAPSPQPRGSGGFTARTIA